MCCRSRTRESSVRAEVGIRATEVSRLRLLNVGTVGSASPSRYFVRASVPGREGCLVMDWKIIILVLVFVGGAWMLGRMMTDSGRNNDDGGPGS